MATNNPTVHVTYNSTYGTASYTKTQSGSGWKIVVTAKPKSNGVLRYITMQCDAGQKYTYDYDTNEETTYTTSGHSDCSEIHIAVDFRPATEVYCAVYMDFEVWPEEAGIVVPPQKTVFVRPGEPMSSQSVTVKPNPGWRCYERARWLEGESTDSGDTEAYDPPKTGNFPYSLSWSGHRTDHDSSYTAEHYAHAEFRFEKIPYTLTFDARGGAVNPATKTLYYGDRYGVLPTPTLQGKVFIGWFSSATGGNRITADDIQGTSNKTIYAHWRDVNGLILYSPDNGKILHGDHTGKILYEG